MRVKKNQDGTTKKSSWVGRVMPQKKGEMVGGGKGEVISDQNRKRRVNPWGRRLWLKLCKQTEEGRKG